GITTGIRCYNKYARSEWTPRRRLLEPLVIIALVGVALHALVDFPFQIASIQLCVATHLGLCWGSSLWRSEETRRQESDVTRQKSEIASESEKTAHNR